LDAIESKIIAAAVVIRFIISALIATPWMANTLRKKYGDQAAHQ